MRSIEDDTAMEPLKPVVFGVLKLSLKIKRKVFMDRAVRYGVTRRQRGPKRRDWIYVSL